MRASLAGTPLRVRITVRERVVARMARGPLGARAALEAERGHGGQSARWLGEATLAATDVLDDWSGEDESPGRGRVVRRLSRW